MSYKQLTGTWAEGDRRLGAGSILAKGNAEILVSIPLRDGWERVGRMRAYGPIIVGQPMSLIGMDHADSLNTSTIVEASEEKDAYVVKNTEGNTFRLETLSEPTQKERTRLTLSGIATSVGQMIQHSFRGY